MARAASAWAGFRPGREPQKTQTEGVLGIADLGKLLPFDRVSGFLSERKRRRNNLRREGDKGCPTSKG
ncbi:hypothetical protein GCM10007291_12390 [Gemmobacter nanjingensis]|uniref:Transposase n=1 Tax=Gemmobacter nanjingensis TaxID=488454 RepID=A0ABQ3FA81_9RHOB|nr:hypothetical protein GCM10007291_12390 [Gemmobacter nanjingensis]